MYCQRERKTNYRDSTKRKTITRTHEWTHAETRLRVIYIR